MGDTKEGRVDALSPSTMFTALLFWQGISSFPSYTTVDDAAHQTADFISNSGFVFASRDQDEIQEGQNLPREQETKGQD